MTVCWPRHTAAARCDGKASVSGVEEGASDIMNTVFIYSIIAAAGRSVQPPSSA